MKYARKEYFLFLEPGAPDKVDWLERAADGATASGRGTLAEAQQYFRGEKVVVMVPGLEVLLTGVPVPGNRGRIVIKSIPFALEENLADDVDNLHFAHGHIINKEEIPVAVVARERMDSWLVMLNENGIEAKSIVPSTMSIPLTEGHWSVVISDGCFLFRKDDWHGGAGDIGSLPLFLGETLKENEQRPDVRLYIDEDCPDDCEAALSGMEVAATKRKPLLEILAEGYVEKKAIDLLQGDYSPNAGWREMWQKWRAPIAALVLLGLLNICLFAVDYFSLKSENADLSKRIETVYRRAFPDSRRIVNPRAQMEQKLVKLEQGSGGQNVFFELYDKTVPLLLESEGFSLNNFRFNNDRFDFDFEIKDLQALEKLKNNLANLSGIAIDIRNAETAGGKVQAKIQIKGQ